MKSQHSESSLKTSQCVGALSLQLQRHGMQILYEESAKPQNTLSHIVFFFLQKIRT